MKQISLLCLRPKLKLAMVHTPECYQSYEIVCQPRYSGHTSNQGLKIIYIERLVFTMLSSFHLQRSCWNVFFLCCAQDQDSKDATISVDGYRFFENFYFLHQVSLLIIVLPSKTISEIHPFVFSLFDSVLLVGSHPSWILYLLLWTLTSGDGTRPQAV